MAIITQAIWSEWSNIYPTSSAEKDSIDAICVQVDKAIKTHLKRTLERQTFTGLILNAPDTPNILLQRYAPIVVSGFRCWYNSDAQGDPSAFDDDSELTIYDDFRLDRDPDDNTLSPGTLQRIGTIWGISFRMRPYQMTPQFDPNYGAVKLTFTAGYTTIPADIVLAACLIVSMTLGNRKYGFIVGSESWNGYSYNIPGVGLMIRGLMGNPDVASLIDSYRNFSAMIG